MLPSLHTLSLHGVARRMHARAATTSISGQARYCYQAPIRCDDAAFAVEIVRKEDPTCYDMIARFTRVQWSGDVPGNREHFVIVVYRAGDGEQAPSDPIVQLKGEIDDRRRHIKISTKGGTKWKKKGQECDRVMPKVIVMVYNLLLRLFPSANKMLYKDTVAVGFDGIYDLFVAASNIACLLRSLRDRRILVDVFNVFCREEINKIYYRFGYYSSLGFKLLDCDGTTYTDAQMEHLVMQMLQQLYKLYDPTHDTLETKVVEILNSAVDPEVDMSGDFIEMALRFIDEDTRQTR